MSVFEKVASKTKSLCIAIDLGTLYCSVSVFRNGKVELIEPKRIPMDNSLKYKIFKCKAKWNHSRNNGRFDIKRLIGCKYSNAIKFDTIGLSPIQLCDDGNDRLCIKLKDNDVKIYPQEILAIILSHLKEMAQSYLEVENIENCVISIPSIFGHNQRVAVRDAAKMAGLNVLRLIHDTTAAAIAYGWTNDPDVNKLVIHIGAGSMEVCVINVDDGVFEVKAIDGEIIGYGGNDIDDELMRYFIDEIKTDTVDKDFVDKLRTECEKIKILLSKQTEVKQIFNGMDIELSITRDKFEEICMRYFAKCIECIDTVLKDARMSKSDIASIILCGGCTKIPKLRQMISEHVPDSVIEDKKIENAVVKGAAIEAALLSGMDQIAATDIMVLELIPYDVNIKGDMDDKMHRIIPRNQYLPCSKSKRFATMVVNRPGKLFCFSLFANDDLVGNYEVVDTGRWKHTGKAYMEVRVEADAEGILSRITAHDTKSQTGCNPIAVLKKEMSGLSEEESVNVIQKWSEWMRTDLDERIIVYGFIRNIEKVLCKRIIIPAVIYEICAEYC